MSDQSEAQAQFLRRLVENNATIAGDVVQVGTGTWAIHGSIPVDGEVIVAEYGSPDQARSAIEMLMSARVATSAAGSQLADEPGMSTGARPDGVPEAGRHLSPMPLEGPT